MYFDRNISENKDGKKNEGSYLSCVMNVEFYFISVLFLVITEHSAKKDVHSVDIWLYLVISVFFCLVVVCRDFSRSLSPK